MNRPGLVWMAFAAAVAIVLGVMVFFTVKVLGFERSMAAAQAQAGVEENVRLALWRMDAAAAVMMKGELNPPPAPIPPTPTTPAPASQTQAQGQSQQQEDGQLLAQGVQQRFEPRQQKAQSMQEFQQREAINRVAISDWRSMAPALLERVSDILPGARLEDAPAREKNPEDTRRLASIPARLVIPSDANPAMRVSLPWNTPLRVSLMVAWGCVLLAAGAVGWMLGGTLALSRRRGAFASAVTHELRTPLTTLRMYAEMLSAGMIDDPARRMEYLRTLVVESDRLGRLIENVLAYSRMENRLSRRNAEALAVGQIVKQTIAGLRRRVEQAGWTLGVDVPAEVAGVVVRTDVLGVQQILLNLVDNACKHGREPVELSVRAGAGRVEFLVADGGPGLPPRVRAFTAFGKAKDDAVPGIGLGLYLSREIARELGGDLEHRPQTKGVVFALVLPVG